MTNPFAPDFNLTLLRRRLDQLEALVRRVLTADGQFRRDGTTTVGVLEEHDHTGTGTGGVLTGDRHDSFSEYDQIAAPASPASNKVRVYAKDDGGTAKLYYKREDGVEVGPLAAAGAAAAHDHTTGDGSGVLTNDEHDGFSEFAEIAAPSTPAANKLRLYAKDKAGVSALYFLQDDGTEVEVGAGGGSALTVKEEDGAPSDAAVVEIQVPNGTLTVDSAGVVSLGYEVAGAVAGHTGDTSDAHDASAISIVDAAGDFTATDVEGALAELQSDLEATFLGLANHIGDTSDAHDASAISILDTAGDFTATDVEGALAELQADAEAHVAAADPHTGYVLESLIDAAGDLYKGSADNTVARLAAPTDWKFLGSAGVSYNYAVESGVYASRPAASTANVGRLYMATDRANTVYRCKDATTWEVLNPRTVRLEWYIDGRQRADASNGQGPIRYLPSLDGMTDESVALWKPVRTKLHCRTAPAGAAIIVQLEFGTTATPGTDLFASGDRPQIAAAGNEGSSTTFADSAIENGTAFEVVIDQVGSTAGSEGEDLSIVSEFVQIDG